LSFVFIPGIELPLTFSLLDMADTAPLVIRKATIIDAHSISKIYNQYLGIATLHLKPLDDQYYIDILAFLDPREELWLAVVDDIVVGWSILKLYSPKEGYKFACETSAFLDQNCIGKGYGKKLKLHVLNRAKILGYKYAVARIMSENKTSINFNLSLGYRIVGEQKGIGWAHGSTKNVTIMEMLF
jgi:phosphinothricin acetyltransferase